MCCAVLLRSVLFCVCVCVSTLCVFVLFCCGCLCCLIDSFELFRVSFNALLYLFSVFVLFCVSSPRFVCVFAFSSVVSFTLL